MRRQRFGFSLPSLDDSYVPLDLESASIISAPYSYPETVWNQIISPEPEVFIPYIYQYPYYEISDEQATSFPSFVNPPITPSSSSVFDAISHYNDGNCDFIDGSFYCNTNTPYGDGIIPEDYSSHDVSPSHENVGELPPVLPTTYPIVTNYGTVTILLRHLIRIDISPSKAVYVTNPPACCVAVINGAGNKSCVIHPNGKVLQVGKEIHMATYNRTAKITNRGIVFTSTDLCLSYVVDASGTKTTSEKFRNFNYDFSLEVFCDSMMQNDVVECHRMVNESTYKSYWNGDEVWTIGGFRIKQNGTGDVKVTRNGERYMIRSSPITGQVMMKTLQVETTIGRYPNNYFVVRKGDKKVTAGVTEFVVQNGSQKAGINNAGEVALF